MGAGKNERGRRKKGKYGEVIPESKLHLEQFEGVGSILLVGKKIKTPFVR